MAIFAVIVQYPPIKAGKEEAFLDWFAWSNEVLSDMKGFIRRRLLKSSEGRDYVAVVEFESRENFIDMRASPIHNEANRLIEPLLEGHPLPKFYEVMIG
ncbi:MAG: antibiotic biosynthesis monooxygenase [Smithella sp.]